MKPNRRTRDLSRVGTRRLWQGNVQRDSSPPKEKNPDDDGILLQRQRRPEVVVVDVDKRFAGEVRLLDWGWLDGWLSRIGLVVLGGERRVGAGMGSGAGRKESIQLEGRTSSGGNCLWVNQWPVAAHRYLR